MVIVGIIKHFFVENLNLLIELVLHLTVLVILIKFINHFAEKVKIKIKTDTNNVAINHFLFSLIKLVKIIVILLVFASFLQCNGYSLTSVMTGLGITGLAIGFAAKETLSSVLGSISIMSDKVYKLGDYVVINGFEGVVEAINFRSTKIRTINNVLVTIPNNITADTIVQNRSNAKYFKILETIDIEYDTSDEKIEKAISLLKSICDNNENISGGCYAFVSKLAENSISLQLIADTNTNVWIEYLLVKEQILKETLRLFRANGINFAFPSRTVYLRKDEN